jgi:hypothetical protein
MTFDPQVRAALRESFKRLEDKGYLGPADPQKVDSSYEKLQTPLMYGEAVPLRTDMALSRIQSRKQLNRLFRR